MKPFITGAAGLIGSELAKRLEKEARKTQKPLKCFDNLSSGREENLPVNRVFYKADICNYNEVHGLIQGADTVFHLAANTNTRAGMADPRIDLENGFNGTHNILKAMVDWGINRLVFTSTCGVYGDDAVMPLKEDYGPLQPICPYAKNKLKAERLIQSFAKEYGIQVWIFRFGNAVGKVMQNGVIRDLILKLKMDKTHLDVLGSKKPCRPFMSVEDCVDGMLYAFEHSNEKVNLFNIAGRGSTNIGQIVKILLGETGLTGIPVHYEPQDRGWEGSAIEVRLNVDKIGKLGWEAKMSSNAAVKKAIGEILKYEDFS